MKLKTSKVIDFFLLQKDFYSKLNDKNMWLYIGIILVGIRDVGLGVLGLGMASVDKTVISFNLKTGAVLLAAVILIGLIDVVCFSYPIFDIINHFKKRSGNNSMPVGTSYSSILTKVMKVYIVVNIILTPLNLLGYYTLYLSNSMNWLTMMYITAVLDIIAYFWFNGAITRGLCVLFKLPSGARSLVFMLVFLWNALLSEALSLLFSMVISRL